MKGHPDHGNSYKRKHLIELALQFQRFSPLSSWRGKTACRQLWCWEGTESSTSWSEGNRKKWPVDHTECSLSKGDLKAHPHSDTLPPTRPHLHLPVVPFFMNLWGPITFRSPQGVIRWNPGGKILCSDWFSSGSNTPVLIIKLFFNWKRLKSALLLLIFKMFHIYLLFLFLRQGFSV